MSYNLDPKKMSKDEWLLTNCKEHSLYILSNYSKTEKQLREKLNKVKHYNDKIINQTIEFLKKYNYINDENYANRFIDNNINTKSKKIIREKLLFKGIDKDLVDRVLIQNEDKFDDLNIATKLVNKKFAKYLNGELDIKIKNKIYNFLLRKGIKYDIIAKIIKENIE